MKVSYKTKVLINQAGEEIVVLKKSWNTTDFTGEHNLSNANIFPGVLKRLVTSITGAQKQFKVSAHPSYVLIEGSGLFRTVTINLNKWQNDAS